jgi:aryl-alcohol dehydrogenase-like predicted oxidoreductase
MRYHPFGCTGLEVSAIALGGHEYLPTGFSRGFNENLKLAVTPGHLLPGFGGPQRLEVLRAAYDLGINVFDVTIDSEKEALGRNFAELPPPYPVFVQTRPEGMCYGYDPGNRTMLDYARLSAEVDRILALLRRDTIDLFNIGLLRSALDETPDFLARLGDNLSRLKAAGKIRFAVADSFSGEPLYLSMLEARIFDAVNLDLSLGEPGGLKTVVPHARELGLGVTGREVFFKGELFPIGQTAGLDDRAELARMALSWVVKRRPDLIILGVDNPDQLRANAATVDANREPDPEVMRRLTDTEAFKRYADSRTADFFASRDKLP